MAVPWGSIISAGASLLGSIFGGGSKKQETKTVNRVDYARMVRDAEAAGFNPLTALRNGGAAGFSISSSTTPAVPLSARIADGLSAGTQSFLANFDPFADQKRELETRLVEAQIRNLTASSDAFRSQSFNVPGRTAGTVERRPSGQAAQLSRGTGAGPDGEVLPLYVDWLDPRTGDIVQTVNPDVPEFDQMFVPPAAKVENESWPIFSKSPNQWGLETNKAVRDWWREWSRPWRDPLFPK